MENTEKKPFIVDDLNKAEWVLEKIADVDRNMNEVNDQYEKMIARHRAWRDDMVRELESKKAQLESFLVPFVLEQTKNSKRKSISLPMGKVGLRSNQPTFKMYGEKVEKGNKKLLDFVKENAPDFVETKESVKWGDMKKSLHVLEDGRVCDADGTVIEGMTAEQNPPTFYTKVDDAE